VPLDCVRRTKGRCIMPGNAQIEVRSAESFGNRQISERKRVTEELSKRRSDIEAAIKEASRMATDSLNASTAEGLQIASLEVTFGITLTTEAGVIVSRVSAEASLEVKITIDRGK
jgi:hypothetical protein